VYTTKKYLLKICIDVKPISKEDVNKSREGWFKNGMFVLLDEENYQNKLLGIAEILKDPFIKENIPEVLVVDSVDSIISETIKQPVKNRESFLEIKLENLGKKGSVETL
jgi:hypothetical protein